MVLEADLFVVACFSLRLSYGMDQMVFCLEIKHWIPTNLVIFL